ncbi:MAG: alpha/beta hydrolase [Deltaproteobacteria bacterium]|jgi:alpha-beta hydrolase superfamily lysophospholipase|nr:alpha/beta hydrolase [Deltaproteobacteria bacterium]MBW2504629.1 alpha/beta hydrolase [Deltaproteobacteria bacterium]MBW2518804.1 alpha/beta hydrolase [Deltaproteobacteria bacterium]
MDSSILNHRLISERYFFPRPSQLDRPFWVDCDGARLACCYHECNSNAKTLVFFHGNGEIVADYQGDFSLLFDQMGYNLFLAEFRGYGASSGQPQLGRMLDDVATILDAIDQPQENLILFGRSVGSLFAIKGLESHPNVSGLILESAIANMMERLLLRVSPSELGVSLDELQKTVVQQLDIKRLVESYSGATLILHTQNDGLINVRHAQQLAAWAGENSMLEIFSQGDHNSIMTENFHEYFRLISNFLDSL